MGATQERNEVRDRLKSQFGGKIPTQLVVEQVNNGFGVVIKGFSEPKPENGWPTGDYKVLLYLDGNEKTSVTFKVQ